MRRIVTLAMVLLLAVTSACSASRSSGPVTIEVTLAQGKLVTPLTSYDVSKGSTVTITVTSDAPDTVHVHGYEIEKPILVGTTVITFVADRTGRYEVETHTVVATIATLNVR